MKRQPERNAAIYAAHKDGKTMRELAADHGISSARVHQIIKREREREIYCAEATTLATALATALMRKSRSWHIDY